jgi:hypothetical protein
LVEWRIGLQEMQIGGMAFVKEWHIGEIWITKIN